jgi:hypothetical protein
MASYADALRGHKVLAPKPKPAAEGKAGTPPPTPKEAPKPAQIAAQKTSQKKGAKATQKKGQKPTPKDGASQPKQSAKASQPKSTKPKAQDAAEQPVKAQFSYAEAVKGKASVMPLRPKKIEAKQKTETAPPPSIEVAIPKFPPRTPPLPKVEQADLSTANSDKPTDDGTCRPDEAEGAVRHPAADKMRGCILDSAVSVDSAASESSRVPYAARDAHLTTEEARQNLTDACSQHMRGHPGQVYNQRPRRFSVGDLSYPSHFSSAPSHRAFSIHSAALSKPLPNDSYIEATIQQAIMAENKRLKMTSERDNRMREVIAAHDRGDIS